MEPLTEYQIMIKKALLGRYMAGRGSFHTAGKLAKQSRRDGTRAWNAEHPETPINLRNKTGSPAGFPLEPSRNSHKQQVAAYNKKEK